MMDVGMHWGGLICIGILAFSYIFVLAEEFIHLRKSKPVMLGAGIIWIIIAAIAPQFGVGHDEIHKAVFHSLEEFAALLLFLLSAMTFVSALQERNVFNVLRAKLVQAGFSYKQLFWITGVIAFFLSPVADNMTTALVMGAVIIALGADNPKFVALGCINIVSAANAGGAFSPFGDITTLMVWQAEKVEFLEFFALFIPSIVGFLVPAIIMSFFVSKEKPKALTEQIRMKPGARRITALGIATIAMAVSLEQFLGLPPFLGMMIGLSLLMVLSWHVARQTAKLDDDDDEFDIFDNISEVEWDTLLFFFGIIFAVSGLGYLGYLGTMSETFYEGWGAGPTNIALGLVSAIIDNIPIMFAVLKMDPQMDHFQWLLVTLTTGTGGTLLSIGSAAGVALMGAARGQYTFFGHLKWTPVLALGYAAAIAAHYLVNG